MKIFIANNAEALAAVNPHHTVEAEFGDNVVEGSVQTLAHHGPRFNSPAPCATQGVKLGSIDDVIGVSHVDLDTVGGVMSIRGNGYSNRKDGWDFWLLAAFVDVNGPHRVEKFCAAVTDIRRLQAYWAWARDHRVYAPRDGTVADVTDELLEHCSTVKQLVYCEGNRTQEIWQYTHVSLCNVGNTPRRR